MRGEDLPSGRVIPDVRCAADSSQGYTLYLPSNYNAQRLWSVVFLFDPGGRGVRGVERFQAGAEKLGYILAGSNNSRNGPWDVSVRAAQAMTADVASRFALDPKRIYTAGLSGGARVAMGIALESGKIAGVIASSAGYPNSQPRKSVPFAIFGTAGTEDFNHLEMRELDRALTTPHRVAIFDGGHTWLSSELAEDALEWMELQAMKSGVRSQDDAIINSVLARRVAKAESAKGPVEQYRALEELAIDFRGLREVSPYEARAAALARQKDVKDSLKRERGDAENESRIQQDISRLLQSKDMQGLRDLVLTLSRQSKTAKDPGSRSLARRALSGLSAQARGIKDQEFQRLMEQVRPPNPFQ